MFENLERWKVLGESERVRGAAGLAWPLAPASTHDRVRVSPLLMLCCYVVEQLAEVLGVGRSTLSRVSVRRLGARTTAPRARALEASRAGGCTPPDSLSSSFLVALLFLLHSPS